MQQDYVALLGTKGGPAIRPGSSMPHSNLLVLGGRQIVVDCGLGVSRGLVDQGMALKELDLIFITHLHSDHYLELGPLIHTAWTAGLQTPVTIYGPPGLDTYWAPFLQSMLADIDLRIADEGRPDLRKLVTIHTIDAGEVVRHGDMTVTAIRTVHPPLVDCFALAFKTPELRVVFSGDTAPFAGLTDFVRDADLLVHEAMLEPALAPLAARVGNASDKLMTHFLRSHTFAPDVAKLATQAKVKALALSHLLPADDPDFGEDDWHAAMADHWNGPLFVGHDGLRIPLPVKG